MNHNVVSVFRAYAARYYIMALIFLSGCSLPRIVIGNREGARDEKKEGIEPGSPLETSREAGQFDIDRRCCYV